MSRRKFSGGILLMTQGVRSAVAGGANIPLIRLYTRHLTGDYGDIPPEDWDANVAALQHGDRIMSVYKNQGGHDIWIITEADRSHTTILFPEEY